MIDFMSNIGSGQGSGYDLSATSGAQGSDTAYEGGNAGITVSPIGINLGSILQPYMGSPENGGYGLSLKSRLGTFGSTPTLAQSTVSGGTMPIYLIGASALVLGFLFLMR